MLDRSLTSTTSAVGSSGAASRLGAKTRKGIGPKNGVVVSTPNWPGDRTCNWAPSQRLCDGRKMLVVIGPEWLRVQDADGRRRIDEPKDWVHVEVWSGLKGPDITVIPVLVADASMTSRAALPKPLAALAGR